MSTPLEYHPDGTLKLRTPAKLPEVLDMLVVGGGPAGTAAAFHAKELGLSVLVIDYDDLMKRLRDYPKDKLILPDFGGGDQMRFPKGGDLISALHFTALDKDEICTQWKQLYVEHSVPAQVGIELLGLEKRADGVWQVKTWNHNTKAGLQLLARHICIGIGRGVPRRFDIPGNTDGIAYRLADAAAYVGQPALVIGGGTSAAEAVIAISNAKANAGDASPICWSYRSEKLPKVSKALAEVFFEAYTGNGNIRYYPNSEPVTVVTADDKKDYLSVRTDRRVIPGRPNETAHLEFAKEFCIACIGEDIPEGFLNSLGIFMATGGPSNKKRMVVTPILETQQPNVYLIGDILSQAYLETDSFDADPSTFREIKHRGNIKAALRDGVIVAKVAAQRIAGQKEFDLVIDFEEAPVERPKTVPPSLTMVAPGPPPEVIEAAKPEEKRSAYLVRVLAGNVEEDEFALKMDGVTTIGQKFCDIVFPDDALLSERHASISHTSDGFMLRDDGSASGVFLRAREGMPTEVISGDLLRMGRQFLLFKFEGSTFGFTHYDFNGKKIGSHALSEKTIVLGREAPDITLDAKDMTLSRRHLSISLKDGKVFIKDLKSVNGTYLKVRDAVKLDDGDQFRLGRQSFKLSLERASAPPVERIRTVVSLAPPAPRKPPTEKPSPPKVEAPPAAGMTVMFRNTGKSCTFTKGQTLCDIAEKHGVKLVAECHAGICGSDPVKVLSGQENLNPPGAEEAGTLDDICSLKAGEYRLACMAKPTGPVEVEIIS
jgi:pSer/pThr/pTyr-binding forkhead associated (FHA) protein/thioredoxin reductase